MGNSRQGQHQTVKTASSTNTDSKQESTILCEEPQELLTNQALGRVLQTQRKLPQSSSIPMDRIQRQSIHSSGFRGLSQELTRSGSQGLVVQPKLKLTKAGDRHEHQADRVAAQVVKRLNTDPIRKAEPIDSKRIMPKAVAPTAPTGTAVTPQFETTLQQQRGQGQSIPEDVREPLEEAFNADFRNVRIHTNERSQQLNQSIQAIAFTTGTDIFFKQGAYQPRSRQGQELLAHELTHVVQQNSQKTAIQRKEAGQIQFSNEPFPEIATFVQDVAQEIQAFSDTWLNSPPSEVEIFPWFKLVKPSIKLEKTTNNYSLDIQGQIELNFGSDFGNIQPKGGFKINYQSQSKKWDYKSENVGVEVMLSEILQFKADNLQYDRPSKALKIKQSDLIIPKLNDAKATVENARIDSNGLDWDKVRLSATQIALGSYVSINKPEAVISGAKDKYNAKFTGDFGVNLGQSDLVKVNGSGKLTVLYQDGKWGSTHQDVKLNGTVANILNFDASDIKYDHENTKVSIAKASIVVPKLNDAKANIENARIDSNGLDWDKVKLSATQIALGSYVNINKPEAVISGAKDKYNSKFTGDFGVNLGQSDIVKVNGSGKLTVLYQDGKWGSTHQDVKLNGTVANILNFDASDIKYDHENTKVSIAKASIVVPKLNDAKANIENARIDSNGLDWDKVKLSATQIALGSYVNINKPEAVISGAKDKYNSKFTGDFGVNLGSSELVKVNGSGKLTVLYQDGKWGSTHQDVKLNGAIANILNFDASDIKYDHENTKVSIAKASITIPELYKANATVENARIDSNGLDWDKVKLNAKDIQLGSHATIKEVSATIGGANKEYESEFTGAFGVNLGTSKLVKVDANGQLTIKNVKGQWSCPHNSVSLKGTVADVLNFEATKIQYHHTDKKVTIGEASVIIPKLNDTKAIVDHARIDSNGLDWNTIKVQIGDIALGTVLSVKSPALTVEGSKGNYSTTASGGVGLHFGEYLNAEGSGKIKLDRGQGNSKGKILVEEAALTVKGGITFPGDSFPWPNVSIDYPIVPGVEAGIQLAIKGGIGASLQGSIAKKAAQDWNLGINPEINGFLAVDLKAKVGVGSAYIAAIQAFVAGGCKADFRGGLKLNGSLKYDEETKAVDASKLVSEYYANAEFKAEVSAGVQAQALYFFTKDLYRIRAKCNLGAGKLEGKLEFDQNGKLHIGKPKFSGVIAGQFDKTSIKLEEQSYELIAPEKADAILRDAAQKISGSGEERKKIINAVKAGYIRSLNETKDVISTETEKSQKYIKNLGKIDIKLARYNDLIELAKTIELEEDSLNSKEVELSKVLENEEAKLKEQLEAEVETLVNEDTTHQEKSEHKRGLLSTLKHAAKLVGEGKEILKDKLIPDAVRKKYHKLEDKYKEKKLKVEKVIEYKRNTMRVKYDDFKKQKKKSFSSLKDKAIEGFPKIADKALAIKSNASTLTKKASSLKADIKESIIQKTLIKLTELGIKNSQSFVNRIGELTELQIKYSQKYDRHSNFLKSAIEAKIKAENILEDVDAAIANLQQLEDGTNMNKLTDMTEQEKSLKNVKEELSKDDVKLDDDFMQQIEEIEKAAKKALG